MPFASIKPLFAKLIFVILASLTCELFTIKISLHFLTVLCCFICLSESVCEKLGRGTSSLVSCDCFDNKFSYWVKLIISVLLLSRKKTKIYKYKIKSVVLNLNH